MEPALFVIAILGCADGSADCRPVATLPQRYESQAQCTAATGEALIRNTDLNFPTLVAECRAAPAPAGADRKVRLPAQRPARAG